MEFMILLYAYLNPTIRLMLTNDGNSLTIFYVMLGVAVISTALRHRYRYMIINAYNMYKYTENMVIESEEEEIKEEKD